MKTTFIYSLSDPDTFEIRYIGKANNLKYRLWAHLNEAKNDKKNLHKCNWINSLLIKGKKPIIEIVEEVSITDWQFYERYWILQFSAWGFNLINKTKGGECGIISENCRKALSLSKKRGHVKGTFKHSEETKALIRAKRSLQVITEEQKIKVSQKMLGVKKSDSHKNNISKSRKGIRFTEEHIKKIVESRINNKLKN